jgi:hypothetical protein
VLLYVGGLAGLLWFSLDLALSCCAKVLHMRCRSGVCWLRRCARPRARLLSQAGFEAVEASTAEAAIALLATGSRIDVVFTDIQLAGQLTGWDVAERFRAANAKLPIIYASGNTGDHARRYPIVCSSASLIVLPKS